MTPREPDGSFGRSKLHNLTLRFLFIICAELNEAMRTYRLPNPTTPEDLECRWSKILNFGDKVLLAGYYYNGKGKPSYFGAVYEHLDDDLSCEGTIGLYAASEVAFEDDGHAIAWAMQQ